MALKPDFRHLDWAVEYYATGVMEKGVFVCNIATGPTPSGAAMDQGENVVHALANPSGYVPAGLLFSTVVDKDLTQTHLDENKDEVNIGQKVSMVTKGWVVTNMIQPGVTPSGGQIAYLGGSGRVTNSPAFATTGDYTVGDYAIMQSRSPVVGRFRSGKDADGYAKVEFNLP